MAFCVRTRRVLHQLLWNVNNQSAESVLKRDEASRSVFQEPSSTTSKLRRSAEESVCVVPRIRQTMALTFVIISDVFVTSWRSTAKITLEMVWKLRKVSLQWNCHSRCPIPSVKGRTIPAVEPYLLYKQ